MTRNAEKCQIYLHSPDLMDPGDRSPARPPPGSRGCSPPLGGNYYPGAAAGQGRARAKLTPATSCDRPRPRPRALMAEGTPSPATSGQFPNRGENFAGAHRSPGAPAGDRSGLNFFSRPPART